MRIQMPIKDNPGCLALLALLLLVNSASAQLTVTGSGQQGSSLLTPTRMLKNVQLTNSGPEQLKAVNATDTLVVPYNPADPSLVSRVLVTDSNVLNGLTLDNWVCKTDSICSTVCGASLRLGFNDTEQVSLLVDNAHLASTVAPRRPIIAWSVNSGSLQTHQLGAAETSVLLASGVTNPIINLYIKGMSPFEDRYSGDVPPNSVKITGFVLDRGGSTMAVPQPGKVWLNIGDSIMSGDAARYAAGQGRPADDNWAASDDGRASYGYLLAQHYGYREIRLAYGGYDWGGVANLPALTTLIDQKTSTMSRITNGFLNPIPDVVLINLGENGIPALTSVSQALVKLRSRVNPATKIIVMIPASGKGRAEITQAFGGYTNSTHDARVFLVDLGQLTFATADGTHPTASGHESIYQAALTVLDPIISK